MTLFNIWVTHRCNLDCDYCYEKVMTHSNTDIEYGVNDLLSFISQYNIREEVNVNYHGGEPLVCPNLVQTFTEAIQETFESCVFTITTNGTIINDKIAQLFFQYFSEISISIDGPKEIHDCHRCDAQGHGSFNRVINTINVLKNKGITDLRYRMTFTPENVRNLSKSIIALYDIGIKGVVAVPDYFSPEWNSSLLDIYVEEVNQIKKFKQERKDNEILIPGTGRNIKGLCRGGFGSYNIDCDGRIYPCTFTVGNEKYCIGDICSGIDKIKLESISEMNKKPISACEDCLAKMYCDSYRCRFVNECITGNPLAPAGAICAFLNADLLKL